MKHLIFISLIFTCLNGYAQKEPTRFVGKIVYIADGDTQDVDTYLGLGVHSFVRLRLAEINAPEMHGNDTANAHKSKAALSNLTLNKTVWYDTHGKDRYGRWIADVYLNPTDTVSVNIMMVRMGYAKSVHYKN